jgi:hypothetical protein
MSSRKRNYKSDSNSDSKDVFTIQKRLAKRIYKLLKDGYKEEAVIQTVTIFEVLFKISFKSFKDRWLSRFPNLSTEEKIEYRMTIRKYLEKMNLYDEYLRNYHIYQDIVPNPEIESLYDTLFGDKRGKINFQNFNNDRGAPQAYSTFFNFDISKKLDQDQKTSQDKWKLLKKIIEERHNIIHNGEETSLTSQQIKEILDSLDFLTDELRIIFTDTVEAEDFFEAFKKGHLSSIEIRSDEDP